MKYKHKKDKIIWMKVTHDEFELPVIVADSLAELAQKDGVTTNNISSSVSHAKAGRKPSSPYRRVVLEEGDLDD